MFFSKKEKPRFEENSVNAAHTTAEGEVFETTDTETVHENPPVGAWEDDADAIEKHDYLTDSYATEAAGSTVEQVPAAKPGETKKKPFFPKAERTPAKQYADAFGENGAGIPEPGPEIGRAHV